MLFGSSAGIVLWLAQQVELRAWAGIYGVGDAAIAMAIKISTADLRPVGAWRSQVRRAQYPIGAIGQAVRAAEHETAADHGDPDPGLT